MPTATFSGRADKQQLEFCDAVARRERGMSFGQYCANVLVKQVCETG